MVWVIRWRILITILSSIQTIAPAHRAQRVPPVRRVTRGPQALPGRKATPALRVQRVLPGPKVTQVQRALPGLKVTQVPQALPALKVTQVPKASRVSKV